MGSIPSPRSIIETDLLVVGAGPAGASLSCFLARYGLKGIMISAAPGTADTPRAHLTNMSALEALRDIGLEDECYRLGKQGAQIRHYRWCETMAGEEYARIYSWGNDPRRKGDYEAASPCPGLLDLPQSLMEPILVKFATDYGFNVRFNTEFISFTRDITSGRVISVVRDTLTGSEYCISSKYLFGADGGRSPVAEQAGLPFNRLPGGGTAYNVLVRCDLEHLMKHRPGNLHWNLRLKRDDPWMINMRMVKPWYEWMAVAFPKDPFQKAQEWSVEEWKAALQDLIGDPEAEIEILGMSKWQINEAFAEEYSSENVFCLGDAVHRHPPVNGLGSNTCIGDAFNLAWKVNLVLKGIASPALLESYSVERQPVGAEVVRLSNAHLRRHVGIWQALGMQPQPGKTMEERTAGLKLLKEESEAGRASRKHFQELVKYMYHETHALGLEMGHKYFSQAIVDTDEPEPWMPPGREADDAVLYYEPCSFPGRRLPHIWLGQEIPTKMVSTHDLAGKGDFCLFTGNGGQAWKEAAESVNKQLGLPIRAVSIGAQQDWVDVYFEWAEKSGIEEDGALLVRPDLFCAWRSQRCPGSAEECTAKLGQVMRSILGWNAASM